MTEASRTARRWRCEMSNDIIEAMRSGEWLRTQWITRVVWGMGNTRWDPRKGRHVHLLLERLERDGVVERRDAREHRRGEIEGVPVGFDIPRNEWRLRP